MCILYDCSELLQIRERNKIQSNTILKSLSVDDLRIIRRNRLNKRGKRAGIKFHKQEYPDINTSVSETSINNEPEQNRNNISILFLNARSSEKEDIVFPKYIHDRNIDICVVPETWLSRKREEVNAWINTHELANHGYCLDTNSKKSRGGGLAIIYRREYTVKKLDGCGLQSIQLTKWQVKLPQKVITLSTINYPHYSRKIQQILIS